MILNTPGLPKSFTCATIWHDIARREWGEDIEAIYVIGDTIYDIQCGKAIGAKTISVATGHYDKDVLTEQKPWRLFTHLPASAEMTRLIH